MGNIACCIEFDSTNLKVAIYAPDPDVLASASLKVILATKGCWI